MDRDGEGRPGVRQRQIRRHQPRVLGGLEDVDATDDAAVRVLHPPSTQERVQISRGDADGASGSSPRLPLDEDCAEVVYQRTETRLAGVPVEQTVEGPARDGEGGAVQAVLLAQAGNQDPRRDVPALVRRVGIHVHDLEPVAQGPRHRIQVVGGGDEEDAAQVEGELDEVIPEGLRLLRLQHVQQRVGGTPVVAAVTQLVELVNDDHRVHHSGLNQGADDQAGLGAGEQGASAPDAQRVAEPAARDGEGGEPQRPRHRLGAAGLANPGWTDQQQRASEAAAARQQRDAVQGPLADLVDRAELGDQRAPGRGHAWNRAAVLAQREGLEVVHVTPRALGIAGADPHALLNRPLQLGIEASASEAQPDLLHQLLAQVGELGGTGGGGCRITRGRRARLVALEQLPPLHVEAHAGRGLEGAPELGRPDLEEHRRDQVGERPRPGDPEVQRHIPALLVQLCAHQVTHLVCGLHQLFVVVILHRFADDAWQVGWQE